MSDNTRTTFLHRWAQRKQEMQHTTVAMPTTPEERETPSPPLAAVSPTPHNAPSPAPVPPNPIPDPPSPLTDADMPPLDELNADSNYQQFFSPEVSAELRRLALRKLFHQAQFNHDDGLEMYNDDFTQFEPLGDVVTHDMKRMLEVEKQREAEAKAADSAESTDSASTVSAQTDDTPATDATSPVATEQLSVQKASADSSNDDKLKC